MFRRARTLLGPRFLQGERVRPKSVAHVGCLDQGSGCGAKYLKLEQLEIILRGTGGPPTGLRSVFYPPCGLACLAVNFLCPVTLTEEYRTALQLSKRFSPTYPRTPYRAARTVSTSFQAALSGQRECCHFRECVHCFRVSNSGSTCARPPKLR